MWAGRESGGPDPADHLSLLNECTDSHTPGDGAQVRIAGAEALDVTYLDDASECAPGPRPDYCSGSRRLNGSPVRSAVVDPEMRPIALQYRVVTTRGEAAGDPERNGIPEEHPAQRLSIHVEILPTTARTGERNRLQHPITIPQLDGEEAARPERSVRTSLALNRHPEGITGSNITREIDLPGKYVGKIEHVLAEFVLTELPGFAAEIGEPQARLYEAGENHRVQAHRYLVHDTCPTGVLGDQVQQRVRIQLQDDSARLFTRLRREPGHQPGAQRSRIPVVAHHLRERVAAGSAHAVRRQQLSERLSRPEGVVLAHGR